jgi:hypothetical protein
MGSGTTFQELFLIGLIVASLTASSLAAVAVSGIRANLNGWALFGELAVVSVLVPTGLVYAALNLPPELLEFLR